MSKGLSKQLAVVVGFLLYAFAAPVLALAQSAAPAGGPPPTTAAAPGTPSRRPAHSTTDIFGGLNFTDEQKAKINDIRRNTKLRMEAVTKDEKLTPDQKQAMLTGLQRIEAGEIFNLLTPEQQKEIRKKLRAADQDQQGARHQPPVAPH